MHFPHHIPLEEHPGGVIRISGTRVPLERVIDAFLAGDTPEQIVQDYDSLSIGQVYAVIAYYLDNRENVDAYLAVADQEAADVQGRIEAQFDPVGIRARLLGRKR